MREVVYILGRMLFRNMPSMPSATLEEARNLHERAHGRRQNMKSEVSVLPHVHSNSDQRKVSNRRGTWKK